MKKTRKIWALLLAAALVFTLSGCTSRAAKNAMGLIDAIGTVTADSEAAVKAAEDAYAALSDKDKEAVKNREALLKAREELDSALAVRGAEQLIEAIGEVTADSGEAIEKAQAAFDALSAGEQAKVSNASRLPEAQEELAAAVKAALQQRMVGTWTTEYQALDALIKGFEIGVGDVDLSGLDLRDYLSSFVILYSMEFREDGTYQITFDHEKLHEQFDGLKEPVCRFLKDYFCAELSRQLASSGITLDLTDDSAMKNLVGYTLDELIETSLGMSIEELVESLFEDDEMKSAIGSIEGLDQTGCFEVDETRLYIKETADGAFDYDTYETYELSGDTLTLTGFVGDAEAESTFSSLGIYPIVFQRAD